MSWFDQLIHEIIAEYGSEDLEFLQEKLKAMRILDNVELPDSVLELLNISEEDSASDTIEEADVSEGETKSTDGETKAGDGETRAGDEETKASDEEDRIVELEGNEEKTTKATFKQDPKLPKMVRMANLCVAGGYAVNGVAEIHSQIVKNEVFNEFYEVRTAIVFFLFWFLKLFPQQISHRNFDCIFFFSDVA